MICDKCISSTQQLGSMTWDNNFMQFTTTYCMKLDEQITNEVWECTMFKEKK